MFKITVNGKEYDVAVQELTSGAAIMPNYIGTPAAAAPAAVAAVVSTPQAAAAPQAPIAAGSGDQCAQMGGIVKSILVKEGQSVNAGDRIVELEAMKMVVPVMASVSGKVSRILVAAGDAVTSGQPLITLS
jgi:glutaconyl-CoA decarboxylase